VTDDTTSTRRNVLRSLGVVGLVGLAGCSGGGDENGTETPGEPTETPGEPTDTEKQGDTPEPTDTITDTADAQPIPESPSQLLTFSEERFKASSNQTVTLTGSIANSYLFPLRNIDVSLDGPSGWDVQPAGDVSFETLEVSGSKDVSWEVTLPESAESETQLTATVSYATNTDEATTEVTTTVLTPKETVRAAWLYNAEVGGRGWAWAHDQGRQTVEAELDWLETDATANVPPEDAEQALRDYTDGGYDVVFATTADYGPPLSTVAGDNPDTAFEHCQGFSTDVNKGRYFGRMDQIRYLTGVAAGMVTDENALGYVAPYPYSEIVRGINAFALGARSVSEDVTVNVEWAKTWYGPSAESDAADVLLQDGVDVMAQHHDSTAVLETAAEDGIWATGYQSPMGDAAGENYLTSPLWNWAAFYEPTLRNVRNREWTADFYYGGLGDGVVDLDDWGPEVPDDVKTEVASVRDNIESGDLNIWAESKFSDWSASERYELMGAGGDGSYVEGVEGTLSAEDLPGG
jgi:basic membrane protein A